MKNSYKIPLLSFGVFALLVADIAPDSSWGIGIGREAMAVVGMPGTPLSVAGVARRTTRRAVYAGSVAAATATPVYVAPPVVHAGPPPVGTIVTTLPPGCVPTTLNGIEYRRCGNTYYQPSMMGSNLVFIVQQP